MIVMCVLCITSTATVYVAVGYFIDQPKTFNCGFELTQQGCVVLEFIM